MPIAARSIAAAVGLLTIGCGLCLAQLAEVWRRKERVRDEARPLLQQERFYSFTPMNTVWNVRVFTWVLVFIGVVLLATAIWGEPLAL